PMERSRRRTSQRMGRYEESAGWLAGCLRTAQPGRQHAKPLLRARRLTRGAGRPPIHSRHWNEIAMAYLKTLTLPPTGEVADAARVVSWLVQPGQAYAAGQVLFELETDKPIIEIAAEEDGVLLEHCVAEGEMLEPLGVYAK